MLKISFLGDVMCELPLLRAYKHYGAKVFDDLFIDVDAVLEQSDYVIANLETVCAGEESGYTNALYSFNTPDDFIASVAKSRIDMVLTANNHCFDRGENGLKRTMQLLKTYGVAYSGSYFTGETPVSIINVGGVKIGIYSMTQSTNYFSNRVLATETRDLTLNTLGPNNRNVYTGKVYSAQKPQESIGFLNEEKKIWLKKLLGKPYNSARSDDYLDKTLIAPYLKQITNNMANVKNETDLLIVCPHMGGQFNPNPGIFSNYVVDWLANNGADAIIASHPHVVQSAIMKGNIPVFFSLGNYSMSPSSVYLLHEDYPEYGLISHLYIEDKAIKKVTFSVILIKEDRKHRLKVIPTNQINDPSIKADVEHVVEKVLGKCGHTPRLQSEYVLFEAQ